MFCLKFGCRRPFHISEVVSLKNSSVNIYKIQSRLIVKRPAMTCRLEGWKKNVFEVVFQLLFFIIEFYIPRDKLYVL